MRTSLFRRMLVVSSVLWLGTTLGCPGSGLDGKYVMQGGVASLELKGDKAILTSELGGHQTETDDYTVKGDQITVKSKDAGDLVFTRMKDGSLEGMLGTFRKSAQ